jgi:hypothetical protein
VLIAADNSNLWEPDLRSRTKRLAVRCKCGLPHAFRGSCCDGLCFETEQVEEIRRMDEDVPRFAEAWLSAEFALHGCGLGKSQALT